MEIINSEKYWNDRFKTGDWEKYQGEEQSVFFAEVAVHNFPEWFIAELGRNEWDFKDYGCAMGGGTAYIAQRFPLCSVTGIDISEEAVKVAAEKYPYCNFSIGNIEERIDEADVVFSSNMLEHMKSPRKILKEMVQKAKRYAVFLLPLEDDLQIEEHFHIFETSFFPMNIGEHFLCHMGVIDCRNTEKGKLYWNGKQILVIYAHGAYRKQSDDLLSEFYKTSVYPLQEERMVLLSQLSQQNESIASIQKENRALREENQKAVEQHGCEMKAQMEAWSIRLKASEELAEEQKNQLIQLQEENRALRKENQKAAEQHDYEIKTQMEARSTRLKASGELNEEQKDQLIQLQTGISQLKTEITSLEYWLDVTGRSKPLRLAHFFIQIKHALLGTSEEKAECWRWLKGDRSFISKFSYVHQCADHAAKIDDYLSAVSKQSFELLKKIEPLCLEDRDFLHESYCKYDVIILSVIDYTFRYQRPQQIADFFVREGHRVFYINANFNKTGKADILRRGNLYQVTLSCIKNNAVYSLNKEEDCLEVYLQLENLLIDQGIRDAVMIADYPTWVDSIERIKKKFGFRLVTDYMDDFTGFATTIEPFLKENCICLLKQSDAVVASSQFLMDIAKQYNKSVFAIRNGTEFEHFNVAFGRVQNKERKVIGYYGAIADWFDAEKIEYLAKRFLDCDIVLIGAVTNEKIRTLNLSNVRKLGEIPYNELPEYLAEFDVCMIPFDTSTDLIKATNPVKFYEYLSAGKKIVATEIPELEPYRDRFVYLANGNQAFGDYVELCLYGRDQLVDPEMCILFAKENDWSQRVHVFERVVESLFPKVSVIVLCYNQLEYTQQCVRSILENTAYPNYELILVDNNSTDDTATYLRSMEEKDARIRCVFNKMNRGFAGGNNDGINAATGDYIVLLNNDTLVTRGWMMSMVKHCERGNVGIVGAVTNSIGNEAQINVGYSDIANMPAFAYAYTSQHMNEIYPHDGVLAMFCVMFSRKLVNRIGKLDENYGIGMFEDDDYSYAAKSAGFELVLPEDVFIHHFGSVSFKKLQDEKHRELFERNKAYFEEKWNTEWHRHHYRNH